jgi:hypothetical protein
MPPFRKAATAVLAFMAWLSGASPGEDRKSAAARRQIEALARAIPVPETTYTYDAQGRVTSSSDALAPATYTLGMGAGDDVSVTVGTAVFAFVLDGQELRFVGREKSPRGDSDGTWPSPGSNQ